MSAPVKIPLPATLTLTLQWAKVIAQRHWGLILAIALFPGFALAGVILLVLTSEFTGLSGIAGIAIFSIMSFIFFFISILAYTYLALITHNEVLIGRAGFNRSTVGPMGLRAFGYLFDTVLSVLIGAVAIFVPGGIILGMMQVVMQVILQLNKPVLSILSVLAVLSVWISAVLVISRLMLRLPSRAIGRPLSWSVVWRMGKGNSWRLFGGNILLLLVLTVLHFLIMFPIEFWVLPASMPVDMASSTKHFGWLQFQHQFTQPESVEDLNFSQIIFEFFTFLLYMLLFSVEVILTTTFLSLAYAQLRDNMARAEAARPPEDPNRPPWEYDDYYR